MILDDIFFKQDKINDKRKSFFKSLLSLITIIAAIINLLSLFGLLYTLVYDNIILIAFMTLIFGFCITALVTALTFGSKTTYYKTLSLVYTLLSLAIFAFLYVLDAEEKAIEGLIKLFT